MFKKNCKFLVLIIFLAISLVLTGCGKKREEKREKVKQKVRVQQEEKVIKIGAILPLTGAAAEWGENQMKGMELAIKEVNNKGGIKGKKIKLIAKILGAIEDVDAAYTQITSKRGEYYEYNQ